MKLVCYMTLAPVFGRVLRQRSRSDREEITAERWPPSASARSQWTTSVAPPLSKSWGGKFMDVFHRVFVIGLFGSTVYVGAFIFSASGELREKKRQARLKAEAEEAAAATATE